MTAEVLEFKKPESHHAGTAVCRGCKHQWVAVTEGTGTELECPQCLTMKGAFKWPYGAAKGQYIFTCKCGCEDFFIMAPTETATAAVYCRNCGEEKEEWWSK